MQVITLTTDMGLKDQYVAILKGRIYSHFPEVQIVDISHNVNPFDLVQASYYMRSSYKHFPTGTVHVMTVNCEPVLNMHTGNYTGFPSIMEFNGHYFVASDNGFFSLFLGEEKPARFWHLDDVMSQPNALRFTASHILIPAACKIAQGIDISSFATEETNYIKSIVQRPTLEQFTIKGNVMHIDYYGNAITNISKSDFSKFDSSDPFIIYFNQRKDYIDQISPSYSSVNPGEKVAIFNQDDLLEIAINKGANVRSGGASRLLGFHVNDSIRVEFEPRGSKETLSSLF